jgi:outer membrane protein TolC
VRVATAVLFSLALPAPAFALQPLGDFIQGARKDAPDLVEARANRAAADAQADVTLARALPNFVARGTYTRNQYDVTVGIPTGPTTVQKVTIQPADQLDAFFILTVPLVDLADIARGKAAHTAAEAQEVAVQATRQGVDAQVVQAYYQLVANLALVDASKKSLDVANSSLNIAQARLDAGSGTPLDVDRARAEVEARNQQVAAAGLAVSIAARSLESLSGIAPDTASAPSLDADLTPPAALDSFAAADKDLPAIQAAALAKKSASQYASAQKLALLPTLTGSVTEHLTNAGGFAGKDSVWQAMVSLNWYIDFGSFASIRAQKAQAAAAAAREDRARLASGDAIFRSWETVTTDITRSKSARVQSDASAHASTLAGERYQAGASTQLDYLQAQRDAFGAEVTRIQADADLINARLQLELAAGRDPFNKGTTP